MPSTIPASQPQIPSPIDRSIESMSAVPSIEPTRPDDSA